MSHSELSDEVLERTILGVDKLRRELLAERAERAAKRGVYYCSVCWVNFVTPQDGQDTCDDCLRRT